MIAVFALERFQWLILSVISAEKTIFLLLLWLLNLLFLHCSLKFLVSLGTWNPLPGNANFFFFNYRFSLLFSSVFFISFCNVVFFIIIVLLYKPKCTKISLMAVIPTQFIEWRSKPLIFVFDSINVY